jgi:uncharacterized protein YjbJ (UPF0337 family)
MNREQMKGAGRETVGKVKEGIGKATGDRKLQAEGLAQKTAGKVERKAGDIAENLRKPH